MNKTEHFVSYWIVKDKFACIYIYIYMEIIHYGGRSGTLMNLWSKNIVYPTINHVLKEEILKLLLV